MIVQISKEQLPSMASCSLIGLITKQNIPPGPLTIQFEQSSFQWKQEHHGPDDIIVPEHLPMCLCEDIVTLIHMGYTITVGEYVS